jgi:branched-chain amino acid transport system substrate-binding protein
MVLLSLMVLLLVVTPLFSSAFAQEKGKPKTLEIGTVFPISGPLGIIGLLWGRGFDLAADWLNERGGLKVGGETYLIKFIHEDGKGSPQATSAAAYKLIYKDKVKFVVGSILNPCSQALYNVAKPAEVLDVLAYSMDPYREDQWGIGPDTPLMVLLMPTINISFKPFFEYLHDTYPDVKNLAYGMVNFPYNRMLKEAVDTAEATGFKVVGGETLDYSWTDWSPFATSLLAHKPAGIFIIHGGGPDAVAYQIKAIRDQGFNGPIISFGSASPVLIPSIVGANNSHDIICNQAYAGAPEATRMMKEVKAMWGAKYPGDKWVDDPLMAWDEIWVLAQAIEKANSLDPKAVLKTLEGMSRPGTLKTTFGPGQMGGLKAYGVNGMLVRPFPVTLIRGGEIRMVKWVTPQIP